MNSCIPNILIPFVDINITSLAEQPAQLRFLTHDSMMEGSITILIICIDIVAFEALCDDHCRHCPPLPIDEHPKVIILVRNHLAIMIRKPQGVLPRHHPSILHLLQPCTQLLRVLIPITMLGQSIGELCPEHLRLLVGLEQRMSALQLHHRSVQSGYLAALHHAEHGLAAQLGQLEPQIAFEVQDGFGGLSGPYLVSARASDNIGAHGVRLSVSAAPNSAECSSTERDRGEAASASLHEPVSPRLKDRVERGQAEATN